MAVRKGRARPGLEQQESAEVAERFRPVVFVVARGP